MLLISALLLTSPFLPTTPQDAPAETAEDAGRDVLELMDVFELEHVADPQISPDGERIVFVRRSMDVMRDSGRARLWILDTDGGEARPLTRGEVNETTPRWSPDGSKLAFVSMEAGSSQLHLRWMDSGESTRLTQLLESPGSLTWSPDGKWLAFTMFVPESPEPMASLPSAPEGAKWADPPIVIENLQYRSDGAGYLDPGFTQVFVVSAEGGTPRQLTEGRFDHGGRLSWTPDSKSIVLSANRRDDHELEPNDSELWELDVASRELRQLTSRFGPDQSPAVSPDGEWIAYLGYDDERLGYQITELYLLKRSGGEPRLLSASFDRDVSSPVWARDGSGLFFSFDDEGSTKLGFFTTDGTMVPVTGQLGGLSLGRPYPGASFSVARDGRVAFTHTAPDHPADLAVFDPRTGEPRRLTALNDDLFGFHELGEVEEFWAESSFDGRAVQGWIVKPPQFDASKQYPLLLEIHGGPFLNYGPRFTMECQLYAAAGYVVVYTNPRGSTSYGQEFGGLIHHNYPGQDYDDLISCVDAVLAKGYVDPEQLFVTGGSGGGVLTSWIVGKTDRFRAAVVAKPVIHWTSFALTADAYPFFTKYWFPGMPWEVQDQYWERSPLSLVGNVTTPTMLLTGELDFRTPISESEQYYQALKLRGVDTALVRIPGASHGITSRPSRMMAKVATVLAWFERYAKED